MLVRLVSKTYFNFLDMLSTHKKSISSWPGIVTKHWGHQCLLSWKHLANVQKKKKNSLVNLEEKLLLIQEVGSFKTYFM